MKADWGSVKGSPRPARPHKDGCGLPHAPAFYCSNPQGEASLTRLPPLSGIILHPPMAAPSPIHQGNTLFSPPISGLCAVGRGCVVGDGMGCGSHPPGASGSHVSVQYVHHPSTVFRDPSFPPGMEHLWPTVAEWDHGKVVRQEQEVVSRGAPSTVPPHAR